MRYFEMLDDLHVPGWYLVEPVDGKGNRLDHLLESATPLEIEGPIRVHHSEFAAHGRPLDYREIDAVKGTPIVHVRVAAVFAQLARTDVQLIPVQIPDAPEQYVLANVIRVVKCIDDSASHLVRHYTAEDARVFGDRIGQYKDVRGMRIAHTHIGDAKIFRPWGWLGSLLVSADVKDALERIGTVGVRFEDV